MVKKILNRLLLLVMLLVPITVFADMGAPMIPEYEAIVILKDGADTYDYTDARIAKNGHLKEGQKITVRWEMTEDGVSYSNFTIEGEDYSDNYVKSSAIAPVAEEYTMDEKEYKAYSGMADKFLVYANEVELKSGPSATYKTIKKLKKGTTGKCLYENSEMGYLYIEADGVKGWLDRVGKTVLTNFKDTLLIGKDIRNKCGVVKANTTIEGGWEASPWDYNSVLIEIDGCQDLIENFKSDYVLNLTNAQKDEFTAKKEIKLYEAIDSDKVVATIPVGGKGTIIGYTFEGVNKYAEYNGVKGWYSDDYDPSYYEDEPQRDDEPIDDADIQYPVEEEEDEEEEATSTSNDSMDIVTMCCIAAGTFALGALATIVLVNIKKKEKKYSLEEKEEKIEESKEEIEEEVEEPKDEVEEEQSEEKEEFKNKKKKNKKEFKKEIDEDKDLEDE